MGQSGADNRVSILPKQGPDLRRRLTRVLRKLFIMIGRFNGRENFVSLGGPSDCHAGASVLDLTRAVQLLKVLGKTNLRQSGGKAKRDDAMLSTVQQQPAAARDVVNSDGLALNHDARR